MLRSIAIDKFRAFNHLDVSGLGRVNLLVGTNNCGKSTVLEAIHCLMARDPWSLVRTLNNRGEIRIEDSPRYMEIEAEACHLFHGHELTASSHFAIQATSDEGTHRLSVTAVPQKRKGRVKRAERDLFELVDATDVFSASTVAVDLSAEWSGFERSLQTPIPLSRAGGIVTDDFTGPFRDPRRSRIPVSLITTAALTSQEILELVSGVLLTPEEPNVLEALQTVEPAIQRFASVAGGRRMSSRSNSPAIVLALQGVRQRVPIGSMGDGVYRMLGIALTMVQSARGIVLIDEIDTGLHYSVMCDMWRMVAATAKRLDIQVFATTHSRDCYEALAAATEQPGYDGGLSIQRIERGRSLAIAFNDDEIAVAARRGIEVR